MNPDNTITIKVADFTVVPGARYRRDGDGSAEQFFEDFIKPVVDDDANSSKEIRIDFDRTWGYASSFISELAREIKIAYGETFINSRLQCKSDEDLMLIDRFNTELKKDYDA